MLFPKTLHLLFFLMLGFYGWAQEVVNTSNLKPRPTARVYALQGNPVLDGDVINDEVWKGVVPFGDLSQTQPNFGKLASEKTEIRVAYTQEMFYVAVVCYDAQPNGLVVSDARRDADMDNTDAFIFILDTYNDGQNGFIFGTNSLGVEYDAQVDNEGQGNNNANRQQGGTIGGFNLDWDGSWEVQTEVGDYGWSAEFAIPLRTLRFQSGKDWGVNFRRNIRKTNEIVYWSEMPVSFDLNRLSLAGTLTGLDLRTPGNLKLIPYVLGRMDKDFTLADPKNELSKDFNVFNDEAETIVISEKEIDFSNKVAEQICDVLHQKNINSVIIEGGAQTLQTFLNANLWDEGRIFTGNINLKEGVKAPGFSGKLISEQTIEQDTLKFYLND